MACVSGALPVGLSLVNRVVCVAYDAPLRSAARALAMEPSAYGVTVVDHEGRFVGILPRAAATLALLGYETHAVAEPMTVDWPSIGEGEPLTAALATMSARQVREIAVVSEKHAVVGTLRDIDAMRFVTHVSRTGRRPPVGRAA